MTVFLGAISAGQNALLQGLRRIRQMALAGIIGSSLGLVTTLPFYWWLGIRGIVPALLVASVTTLGLSWWFARQVQTVPAEASLQETAAEGWSMVKLGVCMTASGLLMTGTMYLVRVWITSHANLNAVGQFQAAWGISATYLGLVLGAMGADYYPRLTVVNNDHPAMNRMVNEQMEVALFLSGPLIVGMITFMPLVVWLLYSGKFAGTVEILRWQLAGDLFKVIAFPLGYVMLAKGAGRFIIVSELFWGASYYGISAILWNKFGLMSTGLSFFISYILFLILTFVVARNLIGFHWSAQVIRLGAFFIGAVGVALLNSNLCPTPWCYVSGGVVCIMVSLFSVLKLKEALGISMDIQYVFNRVKILLD